VEDVSVSIEDSLVVVITTAADVEEMSLPNSGRLNHGDIIIIPKVKVKFSLEQAMKLQRGSRGIALLFL
jgi:hypothetical protein